MQSLRFAFSFLTIFPVGASGNVDERTIARSRAFFPVVGFVLGLLIAGLGWILQASPYIALNSAIVLAAWIICTRALHLDGLMDSFDGLLSGQERLRKLEIMKDSRVGAMGAIALAVLVMLKWSAIAALIKAGHFWALAAAPAFGRSMMLPAIILYPYARQEAGLGQAFASSSGKGALVIAGIILAGGIYALGQVPALLIMLAALIISLVPMHGIAASLGGHTGDTYGALCEISECLFLIAAVMVPLFSGL